MMLWEMVIQGISPLMYHVSGAFSVTRSPASVWQTLAGLRFLAILMLHCFIHRLAHCLSSSYRF